MRSNSLWFRLIASSTAISAVLLLSAAFLLNAIFVHALEQNFDQRLRSALDGLLANIDLAANGKPVLQNQLADSRFALPLSGWYWQVRDTSTGEAYLASPSLLEQLIPTINNETSTDGAGLFAYSAQDAKGTNLRVIHQDISLFGKPQKYDVRVAGNFSELSGEIASFQHTLFGLLAGLGLALLGALVLQVRFALRPLVAMRHQMNDIRAGKIDHLDGNYPTEIQPLATELNLLVDANREIVNRARMQVGNLAHALKTPLSVITNEIGENASRLAKKMREQLDVMRNQINLYLERARREARAQTAGYSTEVAPVIEALARTVQRIRRDRKIDFQISVSPGLLFRGEKQDLEEMLGNLLDNAGKWAKSKCRVMAAPLAYENSDARAWLEITVEDDGLGIAPHQRDEALKRGQRLDETKSGSGLGMSIIIETATMYAGGMTLEASELGGLKAVVKLPRVV